MQRSHDFDTVVVIATHGGRDLLAQSLPKMLKWPVIVIETQPVPTAVRELCAKFDNVAYLNTPYRGYDTGAYLWAYWNISAKNYLFLQDSCCPREEDFVEQFQRAMPSEIGAVGWSSFTMSCWDSEAQRAATDWMYGGSDLWPAKGIFGPIFYTTRETLDRVAEKAMLPMPPVHKQQQQAMERAWAILFDRAGVDVNFLVDEDMPRGYAMERGEYPALSKTFRLRA